MLPGRSLNELRSELELPLDNAYRYDRNLMLSLYASGGPLGPVMCRLVKKYSNGRDKPPIPVHCIFNNVYMRRTLKRVE
jgi:hypothetical protein